MIQVREKVRFVETDLMGVVHHSNYLRWFEMARVEHLRSGGIDLLDLMERDILFPITKIECQYLASAYFDDWLEINIVMVGYNRAKMEFAYQIVRESDQKLLSEGYSRNLFTNREGKVIRLGDEDFSKLRILGEKDQTLPNWAQKWR